MNKGSTSVKNGRILPINNPIPLIPDDNMYAKFEEKNTRKQILKLSIGNGADGHTYVRTDGHRKVYHKTPPLKFGGV